MAIMRLMVAWRIGFKKMVHSVRARNHKKGQKAQHHTERAQASAAPWEVMQAVERMRCGPGHRDLSLCQATISLPSLACIGGSHKARGEHMQLRTALCRTQKGDHLRIDLLGTLQVHEMAGTGENHLLEAL